MNQNIYVEDQTDFFFENVSAGLALVSADGLVIRANKTLREMVGPEIRGKSVDEMFLSEDVENAQQDRDSIMQGNARSILSDRRLITATGEICWVATKYAFTEATDPHTRFLLLCIIDINERKALAASKKKGAARIRAYAPTLNHDSGTLKMETRLRLAVKTGAFYLVYQPQVDLESEEWTGFEALIRWNDELLGAISPSVFIPLAEELGLVEEIGDWVLRKALSQGAEWISRGHDFKLAVNVSPEQIQNEEFSTRVERILAETGFPANHLELEITESAAMEDAEATARIIRRVKQAGVAFSIDDFGVGYSSLSRLTRLPIDTLKIDRIFVTDLPHGVNSCAVAACLISLANSLNMRIIAEGIETREQANFLIEKGCAMGQGYLFGRPLTIEEIDKKLAA